MKDSGLVNRYWSEMTVCASWIALALGGREESSSLWIGFDSR